MEIYIKQDNQEEDDETWIPDVDISEYAIKKRMEELSDQAKIMAMTDDLEKTQDERLELFYQYVKVN